MSENYFVIFNYYIDQIVDLELS